MPNPGHENMKAPGCYIMNISQLNFTLPAVFQNILRKVVLPLFPLLKAT